EADAEIANLRSIQSLESYSIKADVVDGKGDADRTIDGLTGSHQGIIGSREILPYFQNPFLAGRFRAGNTPADHVENGRARGACGIAHNGRVPCSNAPVFPANAILLGVDRHGIVPTTLMGEPEAA